MVALGAVAATSWCLIALARLGAFWLWPITLLPLALAAAFGLYAWWRSPWRDRIVVLAILVAVLVSLVR